MQGFRPPTVHVVQNTPNICRLLNAAAVTLLLLLPLFVSVVAVFGLSSSVQAAIAPIETELSESGELDETVLKDFMICRHCGSDISLSNFLLSKPSPAATQLLNVTLYGVSGVLVQDLINSIGGHFRVVASRKAQCALVDSWSDSHTWYPGYAWKVCVCPKCAVHLGWMFEPFASATVEQHFPTDGLGFYLLIVRNVLSETFVNTLIATDWDKPSTVVKPPRH